MLNVRSWVCRLSWIPGWTGCPTAASSSAWRLWDPSSLPLLWQSLCPEERTSHSSQLPLHLPPSCSPTFTPQVPLALPLNPLALHNRLPPRTPSVQPAGLYRAHGIVAELNEWAPGRSVVSSVSGPTSSSPRPGWSHECVNICQRTDLGQVVRPAWCALNKTRSSLRW